MSVNELKDALRAALERRGTLNTLRAEIRSEVFSAMEDPEEAGKPAPCGENIILNELIREYLTHNNYRHTLAVFAPEVGLPPEPLRRQYLAQQTQLPLQVGTSHGAADLPLLYALTAAPPPPVTYAPPPPVREVEPPEMPTGNANVSGQIFTAASGIGPVDPPQRPGLRHPGPTPVIFTAP